jgi:hypothetical protein
MESKQLLDVSRTTAAKEKVDAEVSGLIIRDVFWYRGKNERSESGLEEARRAQL